MKRTKGQMSVEFVGVIAIISVVIAALFAVVFSTSMVSTSAIKNSTSYFLVTSYSFSINSTGQINGRIGFNKFINATSASILFSSNSINYMIPFNSVPINTTFDYELLLSQNSTMSYNNLDEQAYNIKTFYFTENNTKYFISVNQTGTFK